jgi:hypothetical protein
MSLFSRKSKATERQQRQRQPVRRTPPTNTQSQVFSYHGSRSQTELNIGRESRADQPAARRLPGKLQKLRTHSGWLIGSSLLLVAVVYQMQLSGSPRVVSLVSAQDAPYLRDTKVYAQAAADIINASAVNRNKLTVHTSAISDSLRKQFPELDSATVALPFIGDTMTIYIRPADPALVLATTGDSFIIDQRGRALQSVSATSHLPQVPTVTDQSSLTFKSGEQALSRSTTSFIADVAKQYRAMRTDVQAMTLPPGSNELHVYLTGKNYFVKYNLHNASDDSARQQAGAYAAVSHYLTNKHITPAQYIDVRLQGRVYYK